MLDFSKIQFPTWTRDSRRPNTAEMSTLDMAKLKVTAAIARKPTSGIIHEGTNDYVAANWKATEESLRVEASRLNMEPEELFEKLIGDPGFKLD